VNQANPQQQDTDRYDAMADRCKVLRMACWRINTGSDDLMVPQDKGDGGRWLRSAVIRDRVWALSERWFEDTNPQPVEIEPGCWALPAKKIENRRVTGLVIAITIEPEVFAGSWFVSVCKKVGADPIQAQDDLACYTSTGKTDLPMLTATLDQLVLDHAQIHRDAETIDEFSEQLLSTYEETNLLFRLARMMNSLESPGDLIPTFCNQILPVLQFKWIAVKFWQHARNIKGLTGRLVVAGELPCEVDTFEHTVVEQLTKNKQEDWTRLLDPSCIGISALVDSEVVVEQITHDGEVVGVLLAGNKPGSCHMETDVTSGEMMFLEAASNLMGVFHENIARFDEQNQLFMGTLKALTASIDAKDQYTCGHSERVAYMSAMLAEVMGLDAKEVERIHTTGLVHDVGKIGVPEALLCKTGKLTAEEFDQIKQHPMIGYNILKGIPTIDTILPGVLHHHERWDGKGYPQGLKGEAIPQAGRILALADTFDAMSSTRSYRTAMPRETVLKEIARCAGTQFDPAMAPLFVKMDFSGYDRLVAKHGAASRFAA
jgi:HD-GYP domain-containing protein (c-di-GMP phosphodiesterase class II)